MDQDKTSSRRRIQTFRILGIFLCLVGLSHLLVGGCGGGGGDNAYIPPANKSPQMAEQTFNVSETADDGTVVGQVQATDPEGKEVSISAITSGTPFSIDSDGTITVGDSTQLDYESSTSHIVMVEASDGKKTTTKAMTITVDDVDSETGGGTVTPVDTANIESVSPDGTQVTFTNPDLFTDSIVNDNILLVPTCTAAPGGLLKRVLAKNTVGGKIVLTVENAQMEDAFRELGMTMTKPLTLDTLDHGTLPDGVTVEDYVPAPPTTGTASTSLADEIKLYNSVVEQMESNPENATVSAYQRVNLNIVLDDADGDRINTTDDQVKLTGSFIMQLDFVIDSDINAFSVKHLDVKLRGTVASALTLTASADLSPSATYPLVPEYSLPPIPVGPVTVLPTFKLDLVASASMVAGVSLGTDAQATFDAGIRYVKGNGFDPYFIKDFSYNPPSVSGAVQFSAEVGIKPTVTTKIYGIAGPYIDSTTYLGIYAPGLDDIPGTDADELMDLHLGNKVGAGVRLDLWKFLSLDYGTEFTLFDVEIWDYSELELQIVALSSLAEEGGSDGVFRIYLNQAPSSDLTVVYTLGGTADNDSDYAHLSGTATILQGQTEALVTVDAVADGITEADESVILDIVDADGYRLGATTEATVTIADGTGTTYTISGSVSGAVFSGVNMSLSTGATTTTDLSGAYSFAGLADGTYTVTPSLSGYTFTPASLSVTVSGGDVTGKNFTSAVSNDTVIADLGMTLKAIPAGTFTMGSPVGEPDRSTDEGPQHSVTISQNFWMASTEVTQAQYQTIIGSNPSNFTGDTNRPVETVSWNSAVAFCQALTTRESANIPAGYEYRLPTEAEWEYCCRAGSTTNFSYGQDITYSNLGTYAWYTSNSGSTTHPVAQKTANAWGLYDMHGNLWEWCHDWYSSSYYTTDAQTDPSGPTTGSIRVLRGGGWLSYGGYCRSAGRYDFTPSGTINNYFGFRVVLAPVLP